MNVKCLTRHQERLRLVMTPGKVAEPFLALAVSLPHRRFIRAERVGAERVAGVGKGAGARSSADVAVFAGTALAVELIGIVQSAEDLGVAVDLDQRFFAHVAAAQRQKSRRIDFPEIGNEDDAVSIANLKSVVDG